MFAPALSVIGVWLLARFTNTFDAYAGERAKLQVQFDNVVKLVDQTKKLTEATENIKSWLSDEVWSKQQRWLKRLECYTEVIEKLAAYENATVLLRAKERAYTDYPAPESVSEKQKREVLLSIRGEGFGVYNDAVTALFHAINRAKLVSAKEPLSILSEFKLPQIDGNNIAPMAEQGGNLAAMVSKVFIVAARKDLGYEAV